MAKRMESLLVIEEPTVEVEPGSTASVPIRLVNPTDVVEGYELEVRGEPAAWARVVPSSVVLYRESDATLTVIFEPPTGPSVPAGRFMYAVKATPTREGQPSFTEEAEVIVGEDVRLAAELRPTTARARRRARFRLMLENTGNAPARVNVRAVDPAEAAATTVTPKTVDVAPGAKATVSITATAGMNLSATDRQHRIEVAHRVVSGDSPTWVPPAPGDTTPGGSDTVLFVQRPLLGRVAKIGVALGLVALVALIGQAILFRAPPTPAAPVVQATGPDTIVVAWQPVEGADRYRLSAVQRDGELEVALERPDDLSMDEQPYEWTELRAGTEYCFRVQAVSGRGRASGRSDATCAETIGGGFIAAVAAGPPDDPNIRRMLTEHADVVEAIRGANDLVIVVLRERFDSQAEAQQACATLDPAVSDECTGQPEPAPAGTGAGGANATEPSTQGR